MSDFAKFLSTFPLRGTSAVPFAPFALDRDFYPRSPCGERHTPIRRVRLTRHFYPRSPCGERHVTRLIMRPTPRHFYPRSPCGERRVAHKGRLTTGNISIHVPLAGNVLPALAGHREPRDFYPRSPCGERPMFQVFCIPTEDFYPRSPCGERP